MNNIIPFNYKITPKELEQSYGKGIALWMVGLSGSGKSTIANEVNNILFNKKIRSIVLDGDTFRKGLNSDLNFSTEDRIENLRRAAHIAKFFCEQGFVVICSFISPFIENRVLAKSILNDYYNECFINTDLEECINRDPKGLYKKAKSGEIPNFTGLTSPFEKPDNADLIIDGTAEIDKSVASIIRYIKEIQNDIDL